MENQGFPDEVSVKDTEDLRRLRRSDSRRAVCSMGVCRDFSPDGRAFLGCGLYAERSCQKNDSLLDGDKPLAPLNILSSCGVVKPSAVVLDEKHDLSLLPHHDDTHAGCIGMRNDVAQRLLRDAVQGHLDRRRKTLALLMGRYILVVDCQSRACRQLFHVPRQRRFQAVVVQDRWP